MGQSSSQAQTASGADGQPEPFVVHNSIKKMARKPLTHTANTSATPDATQRKEMNMKNDGTSDVDNDDESDWSDWNAKASKEEKRDSTPDGDLAQSTYNTASGAEGGEEDDSDVQYQLSRANYSLPVREGSQELGYTRSPVRSPTQVQYEDTEEEKGNGALRSPALKSASRYGRIFVSDKLNFLGESGSEAPAGEVKSAERLYKEPVRRLRAQKTRHTTAKQTIVPDGASEPDSPESRHATLHDENMAPAHTTASDQEASSPNSIFDTVQDSALVNSDLVRNPTLKRKRRSAGGRVSGPGGQPNRKRRKRSIFSPPTSVPTEDEEVPRAPLPGLKAIQGRFKIYPPVIQLKSTSEQVGQDQGSVATWVKPLSLDSSLKHPIFNPSPLRKPLRSRAADLAGQNGEPSAQPTIAAPCRPARKSGHKIDDIAPTVEDSSNDEGSSVHKKPRKILSSPKGKSKAKPGVEYSSPPGAKTRTTKLSSNKKGGGRGRPKLPKTSANDNVSDDGVEQQSLDSSEPGSNVNLSEAETEESAEDSPATSKLSCKTCKRKFRREKQLRTHRKNNRVHTKSYECSKCREEFDQKASLLSHQSQENHPRETFHKRRTGPFSEIEKQKLEQFVIDYCDDHGIDEIVFRQMMTDSSRRGPGAKWPWPGVTRLAFLNEYYAVLPDRAHKSMQRYKERYLQNLDHKREWTKKDDILLVNLVNELGPKWIEIGLRLNRTQDSVTTRYKKKLKDGDAPKSGPWSSRENKALAKAIEEIKNELGMAETTDTDENIPWSEVSKRMGVIRTAQQCSAHWRLVQRRKSKAICQSAKAGKKVKSKEFVSSDSDENPVPMKDDGRRERLASVVIPKNPVQKPYRVTPNHSSESDSYDSENDPNFEYAEDRSNAATQARISPELGSSDYDEQNGKPSTIDSHNGVFADPAEHDDTISEPVVATAAEWERILEAEGQFLSPVAAIDLVDGVLDSQDIQVIQEVEVGQNSPFLSTARTKGPTFNSKTSRNPFNRKTPGRVMNLSQIFNETQAPTSILHQLTPNGLEIAASSSSRPSPGIRLNLRPDSSQDLGTPQQEGVRRKLDLKAGEHEIAHDIEMEGLDDTGGESDEDTEVEEDAEMEDAHKVEQGSEKLSGTSTTSSTPEESRTEYPEQEGQVPIRPSSSGLAIIEESGVLIDGDTEASEEDDTSVGDNEFEDGYESSEEASNSGYESTMAGGSDEDNENDDENDSMVKDTHNDFMANIKESAKYMSQWTPVAARKITESDDDSD